VRLLLIFLLAGFEYSYSQPNEKPYVIMVSFDGFRHDYVSRFNLPNFTSFINEGASADALIPSFPSKTFPNHYTLVTGLYPGNHGLVDNSFYDKNQNVKFSMSNRDLVENPVFFGGTPLWQLTQQHGLPSASCFWVGSEAPVHGEYPTYYLKYDESFPNEKRIELTLKWLNLPVMERPRFISLYFSLVDHEGHNTGPNSLELKETLLEADFLLGQLMDGLKKINLPVNVIVVSDHGMTELKQEEKTWLTLGKLFNTEDKNLVVVNSGTHAHIYTNKVDSLFTVLKKKEENFIVYKKGVFPERWHYSHERVGDLLILANPGYQLQMMAPSPDNKSRARPVFGAHGFDPNGLSDMYGIFYAKGPNIREGKKVGKIENIHVYPFVAKILGLKIPEIDGSISVLVDLYQK